LRTLDRTGAADAVHEARKHFKKLRALVQLLRAPLGAKGVRREQAVYRDAGRSLHRLRDARALAVALEGLTGRFFEKRRPPLVLAAQRVLSAAEQRARRALAKDDACDTLLATLRAARTRAAGWKLDEFRWKDLRSALRRSYRRAREAWRLACDEPKPGRLHEWRRRTKDLWYHVSLVHSAAPDLLDEVAGELDVLGEFLGDDRDLVVLRKTLDAHPGHVPAGEARDALFEMLALRRDELLDAAFDLAERIFADSPGEFIAALEERRDEHRRRSKKTRRIAKRLATPA
jgi:CHAD domain-containing protein